MTDTTRTAVARDVLARAILEGSGQSQIARRPDDGFEWYGAANDLADAILAALAGSAYTLAPSSESVTPASEVEPGLRCDFDCDACRQSCDEPSGLCQLERGHSGAHDMTAAAPAVTPRTEDEFRERACPSCGEVLAPADTHWDLMADRYLCAVPAVTPASTETLRRLSEAATPGPWAWNSYSRIDSVPMAVQYNDAEALIAIDAKDDDPRWAALPEYAVAYVPSSGHGDLPTKQGAADAALIVAAVNDLRDRLAKPADSDLLRFAKAITEYGSHHGNCPYESWNKGLTRCKCGLFRLIKDAERLLAASGDRPREDIDEMLNAAYQRAERRAASPESEG